MPKRKVVLEQPRNTRYVSDVDFENIYAAYVEENDSVIIIIKGKHHYRTQWLFADEMTENKYEMGDLRVLITELIKNGFVIYEFSNDTEFAEWMVNLPPKFDKK
jgi:hypothetical protein